MEDTPVEEGLEISFHACWGMEYGREYLITAGGKPHKGRTLVFGFSAVFPGSGTVPGT